MLTKIFNNYSLKNRFQNYWIKRHGGACEAFICARTSRMPIVPTGFGFAVILMLIMLFIWSANHQLNLGYWLIFLLATLVLLSAGMTVANLSALSVHCIRAAPVFLGEKAIFTLQFSENEGRARSAFTLATQGYHWIVADIDAFAQSSCQLDLATEKRGWQQLPNLTLTTTVPLGFFVSWQWLALTARVLVYPQPFGDLPLPFDEMSDDDGEACEIQRNGDEILIGLRAYQFGDNLARVSWKHWARGQRVVKTFCDEGQRRVVLDFDNLSGALEARLSQLCAWILEAEKANIQYALRLPTTRFDFGSGGIHRENCLRALALFNAPSTSEFADE